MPPCALRFSAPRRAHPAAMTADIVRACDSSRQGALTFSRRPLQSRRCARRRAAHRAPAPELPKTGGKERMSRTEEKDYLLVKSRRVTGRGLESMQETKYNIAKCGSVLPSCSIRANRHERETRAARGAGAPAQAPAALTSWHYTPFIRHLSVAGPVAGIRLSLFFLRRCVVSTANASANVHR